MPSSFSVDLLSQSKPLGSSDEYSLKNCKSEFLMHVGIKFNAIISENSLLPPSELTAFRFSIRNFFGYSYEELEKD
eukprot:CAMPEP_0170568274 /NCGR_PEP_ID=MMETSP0211-20121228/81062_1 /TAXON_ID=311385 /ORGANISM="Pseudokeronopsis sp., Strain OXSARD2" /LENGTH=75 /DNA_ID=CAMNT_0010890063 /DNA_START=275 /DNA_END=502 /DNA_ORIENTATION=-